MTSDSLKPLGPIFSRRVDNDWLVVFHDDARDAADSLKDQLTDDLDEDSPIVIVPLGSTGDRLWRSLPTKLAVLIADPTQTALVVVHKSQLSEDCIDQFWQWLATTDTPITLSEETISCDDIDVAPELVPNSDSTPNWLSKQIQQLQVESAQSEPDVFAVRAGILQILDQLEPSHQQSQRCQGEGLHAAGDYWHGIMHRREPDYGNSKYWFRRVGDHPIFPALANEAKSIFAKWQSDSAPEWSNALTGSGWNPFVFVDLCESCARSSDQKLQRAAREIQWREMLLLLKQTWIDAGGEG